MKTRSRFLGWLCLSLYLAAGASLFAGTGPSDQRAIDNAITRMQADRHVAPGEPPISTFSRALMNRNNTKVLDVSGYDSFEEFQLDVGGIQRIGKTLFVDAINGNDDTGERGTTKPFATIQAAIDAAVSGDVIRGAGAFEENITPTDGIIIELAGTLTGNVNIDDDVSFVVQGPVSILGQVIADGVSNSSATFFVNEIRYLVFVTENPEGTFSILITGGCENVNIFVNAQYVSSIGLVEVTSAGGNRISVISDEVATNRPEPPLEPEGSFAVSSAYIGSSTTEDSVWVRATEIGTLYPPGFSPVGVVNDGGKLYVVANKIMSAFYASVWTGRFGISQSWISAQKVTSSGLTFRAVADSFRADYWLSVDHLELLDGGLIGNFSDRAGDFEVVHIGSVIIPATGSPAELKWGAGAGVLSGYIDNSANTGDPAVTISGGGPAGRLRLNSPSLISTGAAIGGVDAATGWSGIYLDAAGGAVGLKETFASVPTAGETLSIAYTVGRNSLVSITPAGTLATLTIPLPSAALNPKKTVLVSTSQEITALTITPAAGSVIGTATTLAAGGFCGFQSDGTNWRRIQ